MQNGMAWLTKITNMNLAASIFSLAVLFLCFLGTKAEEESCKDIDEREVEHGLLYVPGPNVCTQCVCHHSEPKWCQTMFCNGPPYMCNSYKVGKTCCQFECLDPPTEKPPPSLKELQRARSAAQLDAPFFFFSLLTSGLIFLLT